MTARPLPPKASFLGIPPELRLQIYDGVICLDINGPVKEGSSTNESLSDRCLEARELPIKKLALTCRIVANEIRSHNRSLPAHQRVACIDIYCMFYFRARLHRLPCRVSQLSSLELEIHLKTDISGFVRAFVQAAFRTISNLLDIRSGSLEHVTGIRDLRLSLVLAKSDLVDLDQVACNNLSERFARRRSNSLIWSSQVV